MGLLYSKMGRTSVVNNLVDMLCVAIAIAFTQLYDLLATTAIATPACDVNVHADNAAGGQ